MTVSVIESPNDPMADETFDSVPSQVRVIKILIFLASMGFDGRLWNPERDQPLDGLSLTFKGKSNKVKLKCVRFLEAFNRFL